MAMQVGPCCTSASAAVPVVGLRAELSGDGAATSSSSTSCLALSKSGLAFDGRRERGNLMARSRVGKRGERGGALVVRASSGGNKSGENESKAVYDAFFLGKALAEAINERVGSAIGEFLSDVGRQQAEQQKQIRIFQDEVQERAAAAAAKAAKKTIAIENANASSTPQSLPPQPPPSTSRLSNPRDAPDSIAVSD